MLVTLVDDSIPYNGMTPAYQPLGGAEKAFASLPAALARAGHVVRVINRTPNAMGYENVSWLEWEGRRPPITEVLIAFRKPQLLEFVRATRARILWLTGPAGYLDKPQVTDMLQRTEARLVFLGRTHQESYTGSGESSLRNISPGVREEYREADEMEPSDPPTAIVTTHPRHGLDWLLNIWTSRIHPKVPAAELHIFSAAFKKADAGETLPDDLNEIYRKAIAAEQSGIVIKAPAGDRDMSQSYRRARVHLYPGSDKEMYCSTLAESQAVGVPAVARPMGAVKERVIGDKSAFLTDSDGDFADHAIRMLSDEEEFKSASIVARRHGRSRSWDTTASEFETIFR
ncbi:MAG: glycosyltransferase [Alphaproteobacteria bacterium]|nr:glycosyltransferase [Alphaproteobacteria bacterium]|tara:strand:- start:52 stop:1080 length:1029 start_codon:yes stop_codon:yes gene_type:complete